MTWLALHSPAVRYLSQKQGQDWKSLLAITDNDYSLGCHDPLPPFCAQLIRPGEHVCRRYDTADEAWAAHEYLTAQALRGRPADVDGYMDGLRARERARRHAEAAKLRVRLKKTKTKDFVLSVERTDDGIYHVMYARKLDSGWRKHDFPIEDMDEAFSLYDSLKKNEEAEGA